MAVYSLQYINCGYNLGLLMEIVVESSEAMSSTTNAKQELPPSYDQIVDIDSGTAPLLNETFSGSIFGTSTIVTFELKSGSRTDDESLCRCMAETTPDYNFVIRDFLSCVQANGSVSNLNCMLQDIRGTEILQIRKQISPESANPTNTIMDFLSRAFKKERENTDHSFEVRQNRALIGLIKFADKGPTETSLNIYLGIDDVQLVVKSVTTGEYTIFRDQSSAVPLCNIIILPGDFKGKIIFYPETGITTEEQLLCTAAALASETAKAHLMTLGVNDFLIQVYFWCGIIFVITIIIIISLKTM